MVLGGLHLLVALLTGLHPFGATGYMFDPHIPLFVRTLSLFHVAVPALLVWMIYKLRYDRRALVVQTLFAWSVLIFSLAFTDPSLNLNCVWGPGTQRQTMLPAWLYFLILLAYVPLAFYLPIHLLLTRTLKWDRPGVLKAAALA